MCVCVDCMLHFAFIFAAVAAAAAAIVVCFAIGDVSIGMPKF